MAPHRPLPAPDVPDGTVLYDGVCVFCSWWFRFVAERDPDARFKFTQVQSSYGQWLAGRFSIDQSFPETNAFVIDGVAYFRSDAGLQILSRLRGWQWMRVILAVPRPIRDWLYDRLARNRYSLFGRTNTCLVPSAELKRHVLNDPRQASDARLGA